MTDDLTPPASPDRDIGPDGIKTLTIENWRSVDAVSVLLVEVDPTTGRPQPISPERWAEWFLEPQLDPIVPDQVRTMFNAARGAMLYGCFYYPLYALGTEQLYRVADAATWNRCRQLGKPLPAAGPERETFAERVAWLVDQGANIDAWWWGYVPANPDGGVRMLRNLTSHATEQGLDMPSSALVQVRHIAERINELFALTGETGQGVTAPGDACSAQPPDP
jgi:hypothetical protein